MEQIDLTTPTDHLTISQLVLDWERSNVQISMIGPNNVRLTYSFGGTNAMNAMLALNKADLSVKSLHRRIIEKLVADGVIDGTISGTPD